MSSSNLPRLSEVLGNVLWEALEETADRWIRASLPYNWPLAEAIGEVTNFEDSLRVGVTSPFGTESFESVDAEVTGDARRINRWRNSEIGEKRRNPTIVLGDARERKEEGLRDPSRLVETEEVVEKWARSVESWCGNYVSTSAPVAYFESVFSLVRNRRVNAVQLDEYLGVLPSEEEDAFLRALRNEMWRIHLIPDRKALDPGEAESRLEHNLTVKSFLQTPTQGSGSRIRFRRLKAAGEAGDEVAQGALAYAQDTRRSQLQSVELSRIDEILQASTNGNGDNGNQPIGLIELFNQGEELGREVVENVLDNLARGWDLEKISDSCELRAQYTIEDGEQNVLVKVSGVKTQNEEEDEKEQVPTWVGDGTHEGQVVTYLADWEPENARNFNVEQPLTGSDFLEAANEQDQVNEDDSFSKLANEFLRARADLAKYEPWLHDSPFELLLLKPGSRVAITDYLDAWTALVKKGIDSSPSGLEVLRNALVLMEAAWREAESDKVEYSACLLGPLHPFRLEPVLELVNWTLDSLAASRAGDKLEWALERCIPAYRGIWSPDNHIFYLSRADGVVEYTYESEAYQPAANSGTGLYRICSSYLGFHPHARNGLVITLVNPPPGSAVGRNLRLLKRSVERLRVYEVHTRAGTSSLSAEENVSHLGRFSSIRHWLRESPVRSHISFVFSDRSAESETALRDRFGPAKGAHIALKLRLQKPSPFEKAVPYVSFEPRASNLSVVSMQNLAAPDKGSAKVLRADPMITSEDKEDIAALYEYADWIIVGSPSPLGLVAPREFGHGLNYVGRETLGTYGLFTYATSQFAIRKFVEFELSDAPLATDVRRVEDQLTGLAIDSPNGVLRIGSGRQRSGRQRATSEQIGILMASSVARELSSR